jgi:hypothetical protein
MSRTSRLAAGTATAALALAGVLAPAAPATAAHSGATIHPGVQTYTEGAQCTANFVFTDGVDTFIGQAAHCSGTGAANETDGCLAESLPLGTKVEIDGATQPGTMVYNSWLTMQAVGEKDQNACDYNDFALVKVDPADAGRVSPAIPVLGGPTGINTTGVRFGESVYSYGNSSLRLGISQLSPKEGVSLGTTGGGWTHPVYTVTPGVPGDSGSAFVDASGRALGVLSTLALAPLPASNNVSDLNKSLTYANTVGGQSVSLVQGGAFNGKNAIVRGLLG